MLRPFLYATGLLMVAAGMIDLYFWYIPIGFKYAYVYLVPSWTLGVFSFAMGITLILTLCAYTKEKEKDAMP